MNRLEYSVVLEPNDDEPGYTVTVPLLPGCISQGNTVEEALKNIKEAIEGYLEDLKKHGEPIPVEEAPPQVVRVTVAA